MHSLVGVFVKSEKEEQLDANNVIYPFKLIFPMNKSRVYYCRSRDERNKWLLQIKNVIGYTQVEDFYEILNDLGKGKFGQVKLATHIKTRKKVAIKVIKKKNMSLKELELQKREIEVLKICQHPNIIRLLDMFENPDYIYIVLEHCAGGDLFHYLDKRDFKITEDMARNIAH
jgi:serine/threonine protein kinase